MRNIIFILFVRLGTLDQSIFINQYPSKSHPSTCESLSCSYDCMLGRIIADVKKQHANTHTHKYENMICVKTLPSGWSEGQWQGVGVERVWRPVLWAVGGEGGRWAASLLSVLRDRRLRGALLPSTPAAPCSEPAPRGRWVLAQLGPDCRAPPRPDQRSREPPRLGGGVRVIGAEERGEWFWALAQVARPLPGEWVDRQAATPASCAAQQSHSMWG